MAKIKTVNFKRSSKAGGTLEFKSDITVDSEGLFSATVPENVADAVQSLPVQDVWITRPRQNFRVTGRSLDRVKWAIGAGMDELVSVETTIKRVIVYSHKLDVSAWQNSDGSLHANGHIGEPRENGGEWHPMGDHIDAINRTGYFQVGLYAGVLDMVTYTRANSVRTEFRSPDWDHSSLSYTTWGSKLNGFGSLSRPRDPSTLPRLPYTEEAAQFFYEMLIAMCYLGRNLHEFFSNHENVAQAIEHGAVPLLTEHRQNKDNK